MKDFWTSLPQGVQTFVVIAVLVALGYAVFNTWPVLTTILGVIGILYLIRTYGVPWYQENYGNKKGSSAKK